MSVNQVQILGRGGTFTVCLREFDYAPGANVERRLVYRAEND